MARISQDDFSGQSDSANTKTANIDANGQNKIEVPNSDFIANAEISREAQDLILETSDGHVLIIENYFTAEPAPVIESPDGSVLTSNLINSFLSSSSQYAQAGTMDDESPVGAIEEISGEATVIRADGTSENLTLGSPIYEGDVIETTSDGAVNIVFIDETSMAVSDGARLSIDDYSFDPSTESGTTNLSVLRGIFVFTSGLIGRDDPDDVLIDTPVGSIGIRGTIIAGKIQPGGESEITVMEGAIVVKNGAMETTLSQQYESVRLSGFNDNMQDLGVKNATDVGKTYGSVSDVIPKLFSSINDNAKENNDAAKADAEASESDVVEEVIEDVETKENNEETFKEDLINLDTEINLHETNHETTKSILEKKPVNKKLFDRHHNERDLENDTSVFFNTVDQPPEFNFIERPIFENAGPGALVSRILIDNAPPGTTFSISGAGASSYTTQQINNGVFEVRLASGAPVEGTSIGDITITATFADGKTFDWDITPTSLDAAVNLNSPGGLTHQVTSVGNVIQPEKIGDFDGDGDNDFAYINGSNDLIIEDVLGSGINAATGINLEKFSAAGDLNNDGFDDIIASNPNQSGQGEAYIINGTNGGAAANPISGIATTGDEKGFAVTGLGDFDGDGKADFAYSSPGDEALGTDRGKVFIKSDGGIDISVSGHENSMRLGEQIDYIGDVDGNGLSDLLIKAEGTVGGLYKAYVVLGHDTGVTNIDTSAGTVTGSKLFEIEHVNEIVSGGFVGDTNGDGYDDFAISLDDGSNINTFIVYGKNGFPNTINDLYLEDPNNALKINHDGATGSNYSVTGIGDFDNDGFDDFVLGTDTTKFRVHGDKGSANLVTDGSTDDGAPEVGLVEATAAGQSLFGNGHFRDNDIDDISMVGGAGNNSFGIADAEFRNIDGGAGLDTIRFSGTVLDFSGVNFEEVSGVDRMQFATNMNTIQLTTENIFNLLKTSDDGTFKIDLGKTGMADATNATLQILRDTGDVTSTTIKQALENDTDANVNVNTGVAIGAKTYDHYEIGGYDLYIENHVDLSVAVI